MEKVINTEEELSQAIQRAYPKMTGAGQNLLRYEVLLRAQGTSMGEIMDKMTVPGSPFLKLPTRT